MTYLNTTTKTPFSFTPCPASETAAQNQSAESAGLWAVILKGVMWMFAMTLRAQNEGQARRVHRSRAFRLVMMTLTLILVIIPGTRAAKTARFKQIVGKAQARMKALHRRYMTWRQRKCWMWSGGLMNAMLAALAAGPSSAGDLISFDALIPD